MSGVLKFDDFIKKHKQDSADKMKKLNLDKLDEPKKSKKVEEEEEKELPKLDEGDYVKDRYGNTYEVIKTTKSFKEADEIDDWDQISKFKDNPDVTFVIVWARSTKQKKLVFVYGVDDDMYSVKKTDKKDKEDFFTQTFRKACAEVDEDKLENFKKRWRKFIDMVRDGEIKDKKDEKLILNQILSDFKILSIIKKEEKKKDKELDKDEGVTKIAVKESRIWEDEDEEGAGKKVVDSPVETPGPEPKKVEKAEKEPINMEDGDFDADAAKEPEDKEDPSEKDIEREKELNDRESDLDKREEQLKKKEEYERNKKHGESGKSSKEDSKEKDSNGKDHKESDSKDKNGGAKNYAGSEKTGKESHGQNNIGKGSSNSGTNSSNSGTGSEDSGNGKESGDSESSKDSGGKEGEGSEHDAVSKDKKQDKKSVFIGKAEKITMGPQGSYGSFEVSYGDKLYYVMPEEDETETSAYIDEQCKTKAVGKRHILKFKIKDLFGLDKYMKHATSAAEPGMWNSEKEAKERAKENIEKMKEEKKKDDKKDKKDDDE